jgi:hypothetical protein
VDFRLNRGEIELVLEDGVKHDDKGNKIAEHWDGASLRWRRAKTPPWVVRTTRHEWGKANRGM